MTTGNPAGTIQIADWKPYQKNTLQAFFTAILPSGLVLHNLMLHEKNEKRWISFPAREWTDQAGQKQFSPFIEFRDRASADRFRDAMCAAIDKYRSEEGSAA